MRWPGVVTKEDIPVLVGIERAAGRVMQSLHPYTKSFKRIAAARLLQVDFHDY